MSKVGVVLSGCGVMDGSEIHESVLTLLALAQAGAQAISMAPNIDQLHVVNHLTGEETREKRNVLVESARIARGKIRDIKEVKEKEIDALIFPGGYGAAKNLCTFAVDGTNCKVDPDVARLVREVHKAGKPIGAICIAPALLAKIFSADTSSSAAKPRGGSLPDSWQAGASGGEGSGVELTIGNDQATAQAIEKLGQKHHPCNVNEIWVDSKHKIVTTPAYMLARNAAEAWSGIEKLVKEVLSFEKRHS